MRVNWTLVIAGGAFLFYLVDMSRNSRGAHTVIPMDEPTMVDWIETASGLAAIGG